MAGRRWRAEPRLDMPDPLRSASQPARHGGGTRGLLRVLIILLALLALLLTSSAMNWITPARAADPPKRAVVVAGPVHGLTARYKGYAKAIADEAEKQGMDVTRVFHPNAPKSRVKRVAQGADLFVYVGHGNGWPSPYPPFQETTKNGLGLDHEDPDKRSPNTVVYKGADWLKANIELAPNAVVILSHLSYASGNASSGMPIPTRDVAVQRIDNFANGFLAIGAQVVWALGWQPGADVVKALHKEDATMDAVFMTRYRDPVNPLNGWIGQDPGYYVSERTPGATVHIDPHDQYGYLRGITGNLEFTTTQWRNNEAAPEDTTPPRIREVRATQSAVTLATGDSAEPVFTPNGDGLSDTIRIAWKLNENAFVELRFKRNGNLLRRDDRWALKGAGSTTWNGVGDDGSVVNDGPIKVVLTPVDRAGNRGEPSEIWLRTLTSLKNPRADTQLIWPNDDDGLAQKVELKAKLTRPADAAWTIRDGSGDLVRRGVEVTDREGTLRFVWDGRDDDGAYVGKGKYLARARASRPQGTYAHDVLVRVMPYKLWAPRWKIRRGQRMTLRFESAEPLKGKPEITANPRGVAKYKLKVTRVNATTFKAQLFIKKGAKKGNVRVKIRGVDTGGGAHVDVFKLGVL
jgi:flagellar hook assembly protein FlgD